MQAEPKTVASKGAGPQAPPIVNFTHWRIERTSSVRVIVHDEHGKQNNKDPRIQ